MKCDSKTYGSVTSALREHGNGAWLTAAILVADVVGAGVLSLAVAVSKLGYIAGAITMVFLLGMNLHISLMFWRVYMRHPSARNFSDLVSASLVNAPLEWRSALVGFVAVTQQLFIFLLLGVYVLGFGKALGMLFNEIHLCLPTWAMLGAVIALVLQANSRDLGSCEQLIWANCATILGTVLVPLIYMAVQGVENTRRPNSHVCAFEFANMSLLDVCSSLSIFAFAFTGQLIQVEIMAEMKDPGEFPTAFCWMSTPFQSLAFLLVGLGGYYYKGDSIDGIISDSIPFGYAFRLGALCLLTHMLITYLIKAIVLCRQLHRRWDRLEALESSSKSWLTYNVIAVAVVTASWLLSQIVPFFSDLVDLIGASLTPLLMWMVPILLYCYSNLQTGTRMHTLEMIVVTLELILSASLMIVGTYASLTSIKRHWDTYGGPFSCHCEDMWRSCQCSATHAGMEFCLSSAALPQGR